MKERIVLLLEVPCRHECHGECIPHRKRRRRRCGRCEPQRTSLAFDTDVNVKVRTAAELGLSPPAHGDDARADAMDDRQNVDDLVRLTAVRDGDHDVVRRHHAEIPVKRLRRMHEEGGRSRTRERCRDLASDVTGFSHARHDDTPLACKDRLCCRLKVIINAIRETRDSICLQFQRLNRLLSDGTLLHSILLVQLFAHDLIDGECVL